MRSHGGVYEPEPDFLVKKVMSMSMFQDKSYALNSCRNRCIMCLYFTHMYLILVQSVDTPLIECFLRGKLVGLLISK